MAGTAQLVDLVEPGEIEGDRRDDAVIFYIGAVKVTHRRKVVQRSADWNDGRAAP